ncbi:MAG: PD-(D/E)XK nuclease family transposase [Clostridia bacterium]|nr:PD-(D/E)XK nuclease family transposase [Clostridia bacterium]
MLTLEERFERVKDLRPIDDVFFEVLADDIDVCQEILRTLMENDELIVNDVIVQSSERNLYGRSVRLDALCTLGDGTKCNIEVQRSDNDDHLKRARYNASVITSRETDVGEKFENIPELYIIYISEFDIFKLDRTTYHIEKVIRETGTLVDDGVHEIFVNTAVKDGTQISELMDCMTQTEVKNERFPHLSDRVSFLKSDEGGVNVMCDVMEKYMAQSRAEGEAKGRAEGEAKEKIAAVINMLTLNIDEASVKKLYPNEFEEGKKLYLKKLNQE